MPTFTARYVFPVSGPPVPRGTVTVEGDRITAVLPHGERTADTDFGNAALVPGLVNAHAHLDLSAARGAVPPTTAAQFPDWLRAVVAFRRQSPTPVADAVRAGLAESLRYGTTLLGDISTDGASFDLLADAPVRAVVFREVIGLKPERFASTQAGCRDWLHATADRPDTRRGVSPHAPYTTQFAGFLGLRGDLPSASHVAELPGEADFLHTHTGPLRDFLESFGAWADDDLAPSLSAVLDALSRTGSLVVHGNYLRAEHVERFTPSMTLVVCPRTHAAFGHPPHPWSTFAAAGVRVAVGTDSLASNPDLDVLAEIRLLRRTNPDVPGPQLLRMATLSGAEALGFAAECGSLDPGKSADFVAVPLPDGDGDPHELLLGDDHGERRVYFRGTETPASQERKRLEVFEPRA
jgi:cytosine/adenosine deaminase-related metal-dependent hydrolase